MTKVKLANLMAISDDIPLQERARLRYEYFDREGYRKLSDLLSDYSYVEKRDGYILADYITNKPNADLLDGRMIREHKHDPDIDWEAIYAYMDERRKADNWLQCDQEYCDNILAAFEDELRNKNTFCLY